MKTRLIDEQDEDENSDSSGPKRPRVGDNGASAAGSSQVSERRYSMFQATLAGARGEEMEPSMDKDEALRMVKAGRCAAPHCTAALLLFVVIVDH